MSDSSHTALHTMSQPPTTSPTCGTCLQPSDLPPCLTCHYVICRPCLSKWLTLRIFSGAIALTCVNCDREITEEQIQTLAPAAYPRFFYNQTRRLHAADRKAAWCPNIDCLALLSPGSTQCTVCHTKICSKCHQAAHEGMCVREGKGRYKVQLWKKMNTKACPNCKTRIEKHGGCRLVVCTQCRTSFCWVCGDAHSMMCRCVKEQPLPKRIAFIGGTIAMVPVALIGLLLVAAPMGIYRGYTHVAERRNRKKREEREEREGRENWEDRKE